MSTRSRASASSRSQAFRLWGEPFRVRYVRLSHVKRASFSSLPCLSHHNFAHAFVLQLTRPQVCIAFPLINRAPHPSTLPSGHKSLNGEAIQPYRHQHANAQAIVELHILANPPPISTVYITLVSMLHDAPHCPCWSFISFGFTIPIHQ